MNLEITDLRAIRSRYPNESDAELALEDVLLLWLDPKYVCDPPTWQMLVKAVNEMCDGCYHELAKKIASDHQSGIARLFILYMYNIIDSSRSTLPVI